MPTDTNDKPKHFEFGAIGSSNCNKQKSVTKLFVDNLTMLNDSCNKEEIQFAYKRQGTELRSE